MNIVYLNKTFNTVEFAKNEPILARVGDRIDVGYSPFPVVSEVILFPKPNTIAPLNCIFKDDPVHAIVVIS